LFDTAQGGIFFYCYNAECLTAEGATRATFDRITRALGWPDAPRPAASGKPGEKIAGVPPLRAPLTYAAHAAP
jgi:hypothetical protein